MINADWAEAIARNLLEEPLPRRWTHVQGVAGTARTLSNLLRDDADLVVSAAWLHDIGYSPRIAVAGFHPLDGARYLRDQHDADGLLCQLVAHHTCAVVEAAERGLDADLVREFPAPPGDLADALIYCDMTTSPDGQRVSAGERIAEIGSRYGPRDVVTRALMKSAPQLRASVARIASKLAV